VCGLPAQTFPRPPVDLGERVHDLALADRRKVRSFREELAQEAVGVLVAAALPRRVRVGEIHRHAECRPDALVTAELLAPVRRRRLERARWEGRVDRVDRLLHRGRAAVGDRQGDVEPALSLDERRDARPRLPTPGDDGVELPVAECLACAHLSRTFGDGQTDVEPTTCLYRFLALALLAEHGHRYVDQPRIDPTIDGREGDFPVEETTHDLFRGPGRPQLLDDRPAHHVVELRLGAAVSLRIGVALLCAFGRVAGVPSDLPRDGRGLSPEPSRDGPYGHPELQVGLYFHAFGCGKMGVAHSDSSV